MENDEAKKNRFVIQEKYDNMEMKSGLIKTNRNALMKSANVWKIRTQNVKDFWGKNLSYVKSVCNKVNLSILHIKESNNKDKGKIELKGGYTIYIRVKLTCQAKERVGCVKMQKQKYSIFLVCVLPQNRGFNVLQKMFK